MQADLAPVNCHLRFREVDRELEQVKKESKGEVNRLQDEQKREGVGRDVLPLLLISPTLCVLPNQDVANEFAPQIAHTVRHSRLRKVDIITPHSILKKPLFPAFPNF